MTLEEAAEKLLGNGDMTKIKSKIRRLYDISNIMYSIKLVQKMNVVETDGRRTAFRWIGPKLDAILADEDARALLICLFACLFFC